MGTVADVINIAYARNKRAQRGKDATDEELFKVITEVMGRYFAEGQRVNQAWFTVEEPVNAVQNPETGAVHWPRPERAESVHRIVTPAGQRVAKVPYDKLGVEPYKPAVYRIGRVYRRVPDKDEVPGRIVDNPLQPNATLTFYYTRRPDPVNSPSVQLDSMWPDGHETLLGIEVALFLSRKDNRTEDYPALEAQREEQATRFFRFLEHEDPGVVDPGRRAYKWSIPRATPVTGGGAP